MNEVLMRHPAVAEAAAFSVPRSRLGEDVAAAVVLRSGMRATPVELRLGIFMTNSHHSKSPDGLLSEVSCPRAEPAKSCGGS